MIIRFLKTIIVISFLFAFPLEAHEFGANSIKNNIGTFPGALNAPHENEDRMFIHENFEGTKGYDFLFGVLDGHTGEDVVNHLSESISRKFDQFFRRESDFCEEKFKALCQNLEQEIEAQNLTSGSTAIMACLERDNLWFINVGDSKAIFCQNGKFFSTTEHKPDFGTPEFDRVIVAGGSITIEYEFTYDASNRYFNLRREITPSLHNRFEEKFSNVCERDGSPIFRKDSSIHNRIIGSIDNPNPMISNFRISSKDCRVWDQEAGSGLGMSRSFGDLIFKRLGVCAVPDVYHYKIQEGAKSFAVLASDGLWDIFTEKQVSDAVIRWRDEGQNAQQISTLLCQSASIEYDRRRWEADDISVVVVFFD